MKVLVLGGGDSPEREVSLRSAKAVADAARESGFDVEERDPAGGQDFLDEVKKSTVILPILHGKGGEDGVIQKELERRGLPYLGSGSGASEKCFDKRLAREEFRKAGLRLPAGDVVTIDTYHGHELSKRPHVLKVARGGSSIGTLIARKPADVSREQIDSVFRLDSRAILEELIVGTEATVPILDQKALTPIEIIPPQGGEFDYENKYNDRSQELCPPDSISEDVQERLKQAAEAAHKALGCRHLSRVDFMVNQNREMYILEINTIPGLTAQSLYPKSAAVEGINWPQLVTKFVDMVKRDFSI